MTKQIQAYRNLLNSIMTQVDIDVRVESDPIRACISKFGCTYNHYILFAIANKTDTQYKRFNTCDFLAFHGDAETNHINVYEYTEVPVDDALGPRHIKRRDFKEYSKHLADDHIDKFDIEDLTYYIERYIDKRLKSIIAKT